MISGYTLYHYFTFLLITTITLLSPWTQGICDSGTLLSCDNGVLKSGNGKGNPSFNSSTESCNLAKAPVPSGNSPCSQHNGSEIRNLHVQGSGKSFRLSWITDAVNDSKTYPWQFKILFFVEPIDADPCALPYCQFLKFLDNNIAVNENTKDIFQTCVYNGENPITLTVFVFSLTTPSCANLSILEEPDRLVSRPEVTFIDNTGNSDDEEDPNGHRSTTIAVSGGVITTVVLVAIILVTRLYIRKKIRTSSITADTTECNTSETIANDSESVAKYSETLTRTSETVAREARNSETVTRDSGTVARDSETVATNSKRPHASVPETINAITDNPQTHSPFEGQPRLPSYIRKAMMELNGESDGASYSPWMDLNYSHTSKNNNNNTESHSECLYNVTKV